jgi:hypothetical protein
MASASAVVVENYWKRYGALSQINPRLALIIGDFGLGSDAPIILNFAANCEDPPVFRLRWGSGGNTEWIQGATNFDEFAKLLGLTTRAP